jgi:hypothetical protein
VIEGSLTWAGVPVISLGDANIHHHFGHSRHARGVADTGRRFRAGALQRQLNGYARRDWALRRQRHRMHGSVSTFGEVPIAVCVWPAIFASCVHPSLVACVHNRRGFDGRRRAVRRLFSRRRATPQALIPKTVQ